MIGLSEEVKEPTIEKGGRTIVIQVNSIEEQEQIYHVMDESDVKRIHEASMTMIVAQDGRDFSNRRRHHIQELMYFPEKYLDIMSATKKVTKR